MKLVKMSLAAAMLMGASAYAVENIKVSGGAKVIYQTSDVDGSTASMFDHNTNSAAGVGVTLGATADLSNNMKGAVEMTAFDTLGLESNVVGSVMATGQLNTLSWASVANVAATFGNTTAVVGRQELDTPLAFTEKWNVVKNTFDAAVIVNSDIPNTTLVGAYVGKQNSLTAAGQVADNQFTTYQAQVNSLGTTAGDGAYAFGAVFAGIPNNTIQAWYYDINRAADALWLQVDGKLAAGDIGISYGAQYAQAEVDGQLASVLGATGTDLKTDAFALKVGVDVVGVHVFAAYSDVSAGVLGFYNTATGDKTKLYTGTASIWADGAQTAAEDTEAYKVGVSGKVGSVALAANFTDWEHGLNAGTAVTRAATIDRDAWDVSAATTLAGLGLKAIYTSYDNGAATNSVTDTLRLIITAKF
jgi:hypothetical protein